MFIKFKGMTQGMLVVLGEKNIKKLKILLILSSDELLVVWMKLRGKELKLMDI